MLLKRYLPRLGLALTLCLPLAPAPVWARISSLSNLFVFGDSLSDSGNSGFLSANSFPPTPYVENRFSNGAVAVEYLWQAFNPGDTSFQASLAGGTNYAIGGATTGNENFVEVWPVTPNSLKPLYGNLGNAWQLAQFQANNPSFDPATSLFLVWLFPNDVFYVNNTAPPTGVGSFSGSEGAPLSGPPQTFASQIINTAVANLIGTIDTLANAGGRNFLVVNTPDLGLIPEFLGTPQAPSLTGLSNAFNAGLDMAVNGLVVSRPELSITFFEIDKLFADVINNPSSFGLSNVTSRCLVNPQSEPCSTPDQYLFWDGSHPTTTVHALIGQRFYETIHQSPPVPGPLPATGVVMVFAWSRRMRSRIRQGGEAARQASEPKNQP